MNAETKSNPNETCESIKLGIDAHAKWYYVGRQIDGVTPQPVQKMTFEGLLRFVAKQQRLALARAWALEPDVIFLDEPTASLDPRTGRQIMRLLCERNGGAFVALNDLTP